jgi:hypothetical protein
LASTTLEITRYAGEAGAFFFWNNEILENLAGVIETIGRALGPYPPPPP